MTEFMSTEKCRKSAGATLHRAVEVCVEVVEALKFKGLPKNGMKDAGKASPNPAFFELGKTPKIIMDGGGNNGRDGIMCRKQTRKKRRLRKAAGDRLLTEA